MNFSAGSLRNYGVTFLLGPSHFFLILSRYSRASINWPTINSSPDSPYRTPISGAILKLQENGILQDLKKKWWEERGGGLCSKDSAEPANSSELGIANVGGVFLVLIFGCCGSFVIGVCEFLWNVRKVAVKEKVSPLPFLHRTSLSYPLIYYHEMHDNLPP